ncbi:MAG: FkbM family methyltransferase [Deltaproteobacteria bacterium]|nr:FkbM family methyltransferase [Deltaproteobacteria bacterium]
MSATNAARRGCGEDPQLPAVVIVTTGRNPPLLRTLVMTWLELGHVVVCALPEASMLPPAVGLVRIEGPTTGADFGAAIDAAIAACPPGDVYLGADDVLPCGGDWSVLAVTPPDAICAIRLRSVSGQRWGDWARYDGVHIANLSEDAHDTRAFIAGNAMVLRGRARTDIRWSGRGWHQGDDILLCWEAVALGITLVPPSPDGPVLVHLDRLPPSAADPERLGVDLLSGAPLPARAPLETLELGGLRLATRPGTWDEGIAREVIEADFYLLRLWQPRRPPRFIVDVGAHIGSFTAFAARTFPNARVIGLEAYAANALLAGCNTADLANAVVLHRAVWSESRVLGLSLANGPNSGGHRTLLTEGHHVVRAETLADLAARFEIDSIDFLKLDCEGAEWEILPQVNQRGGVRVELIAMELHLDDGDRTLKAAETLLRERFDVTHVRTTGDPRLLRVHAMGARHAEVTE